jgi:hypothetical protein
LGLVLEVVLRPGRVVEPLRAARLPQVVLVAPWGWLPVQQLMPHRKVSKR